MSETHKINFLEIIANGRVAIAHRGPKRRSRWSVVDGLTARLGLWRAARSRGLNKERTA
jgi:hypothetical protein